MWMLFLCKSVALRARAVVPVIVHDCSLRNQYTYIHTYKPYFRALYSFLRSWAHRQAYLSLVASQGSSRPAAERARPSGLTLGKIDREATLKVQLGHSFILFPEFRVQDIIVWFIFSLFISWYYVQSNRGHTDMYMLEWIWWFETLVRLTSIVMFHPVAQLASQFSQTSISRSRMR